MPLPYLLDRDSNAPQRLRDNGGKIKVSESQNLFEADFEYGLQPMRWESYTVGGGTVVANSGLGGVVMSVTAANGDLAMRQTRPYIRYQPGKTIYMASGILFGPANANQKQRVGFFDDANGLFFEQGDPVAGVNPYGMNVVYRSDVNGAPFDTRIALNNWNDPNRIVSTINWNDIQMIWIEFAWYGAGLLRWGVIIDGEPYPVHQIGIGNLASQTVPWARTGNLPVRYELRNTGATVASSMTHFGVSVLAEGRIDTQRGFTNGYGMAAGVPARTVPINSVRYPLLSIRYRTMGTLEYGVDAAYSGANGALPLNGAAIASASNSATASTVTLTGTPLVANAWTGKYIFCRGSTASISGIVISGGVATATTSANPNYLTVGRYVTVGGSTATSTVAFSNGSSAITGTGLPFAAGTPVTFATTGALPTNFATATTYYILAGSTATSITVAASINGTAIVAGSAGSGTQTMLSSVNGVVLITGVTASTFTYATNAAGTVTGTITYASGQGSVGRITSNTTSALTVVDNVQGGPMPVLPAASGNYILGEIDRGQVLPQLLSIFSSQNCTLELIGSTSTSPVTLSGGTSVNGTTYATEYSLGAVNSFVERDVTSTGLTGGEVVYNSPLPTGGLQAFDLSTLFPLYNTIQGNTPDILTIAITTSGTAASVGASIVAQEAMS